ncbi:MAG: AI-2E family transporter [Eubacterium sp.]|nr:AI-2E family transporter [Eubacterium sp.]
MIDKRYLKISLYAVFTLIVFYALKKAVDIAVIIIANIDDVFMCLARISGRALSVFSLPVIAFVIAYLLDPFCDYFQEIIEKRLKLKTKKRIFGVTAVYALIIGLAALGLFFAFRSVGRAVPFDELVSDSIGELNSMYDNLTAFLEKRGLYSYFSAYADEALVYIRDSTERITNAALKKAPDIGNFLLNLLLGFVVAFYFLLDKERFLGSTKTFFERVLPKKAYKVLKGAALEAHSVFSGYIRGQLTDALIMSLLIASVLTILRVRFAVVIGVISGFSNIIPYFGAIVGFTLAVFSALLSGDALKAVYAAVSIIALQQLDSCLIAPKIVGEKVELSPPAVIIALAVGGKLFGLWGMVFAVPVTGILKNVVMRQKLI